MKNFWNGGYELIDSGDGEKLERFGDKVLLRPSTVSFWKKRKTSWDWDARWEPKKGWIFKKEKFFNFEINFQFVKLEIKLQSNGQIGVFPEHAIYMSELEKLLVKDDMSVLNLFAYTGMASNLALKLNANVTHVDIIKKCLDWMQTNQKLNGLQDKALKLLPEDALVYLRREAKRGKKYDIVIADPPSFYRIDHSRVWNLEENFHHLMELILPVLSTNGHLFISCHSFNLEVFRNLIMDYKDLKIKESYNLNLEDSSHRMMPAGVFALCEYLGK